METQQQREVAALEKGAACCAWNFCGQRLAVGSFDGAVSVYHSHDSSPASSPSHNWKVHTNGISSVAWLPPEAGDAIACVCVDGTFSIWEEVGQADQTITWKRCFLLESSSCRMLDVNFRVFSTGLKMITAYSDGHVKIFELLDSLDLDKWQLQSDFQNVVDSVSRFGNYNCSSASIAWKPREAQHLQSPASFVIGFNSDSSQLNSSKIWEFDEARNRWVLVGELALPEEKGDGVNALAWAPNIGRPYELIAVASYKGIAIWHVGLNPGSDGRLSTKKVALLPGHDGEQVWQLDWDMSGMTLASTGDDGMVRLWQCNLNGVWHEQAALDCGTVQT
ncbi:Nucleoporin SEH1 [Rhynchospora pubera]|uniref:Nucleoporin SEH1 n=1 Tax=Rhynchospora pubera TaxID=906938 RepID=A0AAV8C351_9POAL|nr:Nucleoporin SEH1 [Rhynchospora pubera]